MKKKRLLSILFNLLGFLANLLFVLIFILSYTFYIFDKYNSIDSELENNDTDIDSKYRGNW